MRRLLPALAALALAAAPSSALALSAVTGEYHGTSQHHGAISFYLNHARTLITNFRVSGHILLASTAFHHSEHSIGHFGVTSHGVHIWGAWQAANHPWATGGYSYDRGGTHVISHWSARVL